MRKIVIFCVCLVLFLSVTKLALAEDAKQMNADLRSVVEANFAAYEKEDIDAAMETIHTQSPGYIQTREISNQLFPYYDLKYELLEFQYIATSGEYGLARAKQKTSKIEGPQFQNNVLDMIHVFRKENGKWKFWSQAVLETSFID